MVSGISGNYSPIYAASYGNRQIQPVAFKAGSRENDTVEFSQKKQKELSTGAKIAIGAGVALALAIGADFLFCKGKHVKNLLEKLKGKKTKPEINPEVKPDVKPKVNPEVTQPIKPVVKPEVNPEVVQEIKPVVNSEVTQAVKPQVIPEIKPVVKPEVISEIKPEVNPEVTQVIKSEVKPNVIPEIDSAINEAKSKAEKEIEKLSKEISGMSRFEIAQQRLELNGWGSEIAMLEKKAKKEGLTELENVRLDFLKQKLSMFNEREKQIAQSLEKYVPTTSKNSAVSMHHYINGENTRFREAISDKAKNPGELSELKIKNIENMEKRMAEIDKEFAQLPPLEKDCIVYRGRAENPIFKRYNIDFETMGNAKAGDVVIPDTGYSYTAFHYDMANNWCQGGRMSDIDNNPLRTIMYEIHLPKGAKVSRNLEHGGEVVMPRGAQYKVLSKKVCANGDIEAVLEYILPKS